MGQGLSASPQKTAKIPENFCQVIFSYKIHLKFFLFFPLNLAAACDNLWSPQVTTIFNPEQAHLPRKHSDS
jgi:hypothetical protein